MKDYQEPQVAPEGGLQSLEELNQYQVVRSEFISPTYRPKVTINRNEFYFSASCVRLFEDTVHVLILVRPEEKRIIIKPCDENTKDAFKWCVIKNGKRQPRHSVCRIFGAKLYDVMQWIPENRYKVQAIYQILGGERLLVFNLEECEMVVPEIITLDDGKTVRKLKKYYPHDWRESFGMTFQEHSESYKVDINAHYLLSNARDGSQRDYVFTEKNVKGRLPTDSEIIVAPYSYVTDDE